jgi:DNA-binding transcriptional MerR regulator
MQEEYLTIEEAAERYGVSKKRIFQYMKEYDITKYRFDGDQRTYVKGTDLTRLGRRRDDQQMIH